MDSATDRGPHGVRVPDAGAGAKVVASRPVARVQVRGPSGGIRARRRPLRGRRVLCLGTMRPYRDRGGPRVPALEGRPHDCQERSGDVPQPQQPQGRLNSAVVVRARAREAQAGVLPGGRRRPSVRGDERGRRRGPASVGTQAAALQQTASLARPREASCGYGMPTDRRLSTRVPAA